MAQLPPLTEVETADLRSAGDDLVARARRGDRAAFTGLVEARLDRTFRMASAILGNEADARDVVQDSFIKAWQQLPGLRDAGRFDAWLNQIVRNGCRDRLRQRNRSREIDLSTIEAPTTDSTEHVGDLQALEGAFERLTADQRQILVLHHLHHVSVSDLAGQLGIPIGTAKWRLHAARQALEQALEKNR